MKHNSNLLIKDFIWTLNHKDRTYQINTIHFFDSSGNLYTMEHSLFDTVEYSYTNINYVEIKSHSTYHLKKLTVRKKNKLKSCLSCLHHK